MLLQPFRICSLLLVWFDFVCRKLCHSFFLLFLLGFFSFSFFIFQEITELSLQFCRLSSATFSLFFTKGKIDLGNSQIQIELVNELSNFWWVCSNLGIWINILGGFALDWIWELRIWINNSSGRLRLRPMRSLHSKIRRWD